MKLMNRRKSIKIIFLIILCMFSLIGCQTNSAVVEDDQEHIDHKQDEISEEVLEVNIITEKEIEDVYKRRCDAMVNRDIETLDSLMSDDIILTHITGATQTKWEWLECIRDESMRYYDIEVVNYSIDVTGESAFMEHTARLDARIFGSRGVWTLSGSSYYEKIDGQLIWMGSSRPESQ